MVFFLQAGSAHAGTQQLKVKFIDTVELIETFLTGLSQKKDNNCACERSVSAF